MPKLVKDIDVIGKTFNYLTIVEKSISSRCSWKCECICGNIRHVQLSHLKRGETKSCGCKNTFGGHQNKKYEAKEASYRAKVSNYKSHAKQRGLSWDLPYEVASELLKSNCYYCGICPQASYNVLIQNRSITDKNRITTGKIKYNGIDRIDNLKGYIKDNVVTCCRTCNTAKLDKTQEQFFSWIEKVYNFRSKI